MVNELPNRLQKLFLKNILPHALLFTGADMMELESIAIAFAEKLLCVGESESLKTKVRKGNHPDLHLYRPEGKTGMHSIQSLRTLCQEATFVPYEAPKKCFIITDAERMLPSSSNALLKLVEEPPSRTALLFLSSLPEQIIPTLLSRCQRYHFGSKEKHSLIDETEQQFLASLPEGFSLENAEAIAEKIELEKKAWEKELRSSMLVDMSSQQKEAIEKELEGAIALRFQERVRSFLYILLQWYRDRYVIELGLQQDLLFFPQYLKQLQKTAFLPLPFAEKAFAQAKLGVERGIKLQTCLEALFITLQHPSLL